MSVFTAKTFQTWNLWATSIRLNWLQTIPKKRKKPIFFKTVWLQSSSWLQYLNNYREKISLILENLGAKLLMTVNWLYPRTKITKNPGLNIFLLNPFSTEMPKTYWFFPSSKLIFQQKLRSEFLVHNSVGSVQFSERHSTVIFRILFIATASV